MHTQCLGNRFFFELGDILCPAFSKIYIIIDSGLCNEVIELCCRRKMSILYLSKNIFDIFLGKRALYLRLVSLYI